MRTPSRLDQEHLDASLPLIIAAADMASSATDGAPAWQVIIHDVELLTTDHDAAAAWLQHHAIDTLFAQDDYAYCHAMMPPPDAPHIKALGAAIVDVIPRNDGSALWASALVRIDESVRIDWDLAPDELFTPTAYAIAATLLTIAVPGDRHLRRARRAHRLLGQLLMEKQPRGSGPTAYRGDDTS